MPSIEVATLSEIEAELQSRSDNKDSGGPLADYTVHELAARLRDLQKVVYGTDDRQDFYEIKDPGVLNAAQSVCALFDSLDINDNGDGTATLRTRLFRERRTLCQGERFAEQPTGAFCSGFLVAPDLVATAGHCIDETKLTEIRFVFGFRMEAADRPVLRVPTKDIYTGTKLLGRIEVSTGPDWALVKLDRPASDRPYARIRRDGRIADLASVYVIGHPSKLPLKHAGGAEVRDNTPATFFVANLDTYGGNSGSPVFSAEHVVEGILVRGDADFVKGEDGCYISKVCPTTGCRGEDCTRISELAHLVPE